MKKILILFVIGVAYLTSSNALHAQSQDMTYLNVVTGDASESYLISSLQKITFQDGKMQVFSTDVTSDYTLSSLEKLYFSASGTGILSSLAGNERIYYDSISECIYMENTDASQITIYDLNGVVVKKISASKNQNVVSLADLSKRGYLVRVNNTVIKILK